MNEQELKNALVVFLKKIKNAKVTWYLEGSASLFVQGVNVQPKDIDITTTKESLKVFKEILKKHISEEGYKEEIKAQIIKCLIKNCEIEIAVYDEKEKSNFNTMQRITWKGLTLPVQSLKQTLKFYKRIKRREKARIIEKFLTSSNSSKQEK